MAALTMLIEDDGAIHTATVRKPADLFLVHSGKLARTVRPQNLLRFAKAVRALSQSRQAAQVYAQELGQTIRIAYHPDLAFERPYRSAWERKPIRNSSTH